MTSSGPQIRKLFSDHFQIEENRLQPEATVESLGLDSLDMVDFIYTIEREFRIRLPEREMRSNTLQDIVLLVDELRKEQHRNPANPSAQDT